MQFSFDARQLEFRAQLRALAEKHCPPSALRASWEEAPGWSAARWAELADLGVVGLTVPEDHGGLGLGVVDLVLLLEETGRSGLPEPLLETVAVGVPVLAGVPGAAADAVRDRWLGRVAGGECVIGVADPARPALVNAGADLYLVWSGGALVACAAERSAQRTLRSIDGGRHFVEVVVDEASATVLAEGEAAVAWQATAADHGALGAAAVLVGVADRLLSMASDYVKQRTQFGKPIGTFQAVKHHLANALVRLEFARPLVYRAAWSLDEREPTASRAVSMAKASASDAATVAARMALQVHGAIGYTWEHDLHLWMKRAWSLAAAWGDAGTHRARVLDLL